MHSETPLSWAVTIRLVTYVDVEVKRPRVVSQQMQIRLANADAESAKDYYRMNLLIPFLNHVFAQTTERFSRDFSMIRQLPLLTSGLCPHSPYQNTGLQAAVLIYILLAVETRGSKELGLWNPK